ncbi:MAG: T9SS type A sorting domain-containing protein [Sphingobacteriales bacterium]|nr:T9SS type A sorting domain-containing protein [Sphingobacteriales bacterium]
MRNASKSVSVAQTLAAGKKYVIVLNGVTNDTAFQKNPDSVNVLLNIVVIDQSVLPVPAVAQTTLAFVNGSTDAPAFDLYSNDGLNTLLIDNDSLNQALAVSLQDTILKLKLNTADGGFTISYFLFSLTGLGGQITTALTSGFFAPGSNQNGTNFSIYIVDSSGNVIETPSVSLIKNKNSSLEKLTLFPNPAVESLTLDYTLAESASIRVSVFNMNGAMVADEAVGLMAKGMHQTKVTLPELPGGMYFLRLQSELVSNTVRFFVK